MDECEQGYVLKKGECVERKDFQNCREMNEDASSCDECRKGYGLIEGKCQKCSDANCNKCNGNINVCEEKSCK